jgi:putative sugar O-methyltransferase
MDHAEEYGATSWWQRVRTRNLSPVQMSLVNFDIKALGRMYERFYRDPCSQGLVGWPRSWDSGTDREHIEEAELRILRDETHYRIGCWRAQTGERYPVSALESPDVGKPFGVWVDGSFVVARAEYHHACACRTSHFTSADGTVVEIGGGYGGMAYHLLRARTGIRYIDFDVPETLALAAYYLGNALPERKLVLCGEEEGALNGIEAGAIALLPPWRMACMPDKSADVTFSAHLLCDLAPVARERYLMEIARFTKGYLVNCGREDDGAAEAFDRHFHLTERRRTVWRHYRDPEAKESEQLFRPQLKESANSANC